MDVPNGRVNYEPNSLSPNGPRENPREGFVSHPVIETGEKVRERSETFSDHYSQARMFFNSMSDPEKGHIVSAFAFELAKVETLAIRTRMLGHLKNIDRDLHDQVADKLGMSGMADAIKPVVAPKLLKPSPSLSLIKKMKPTLKGRKVGIFVSPGAPRKVVDSVSSQLKKLGAAFELISTKPFGINADDGNPFEIQHSIAGAPSVMYDAVVVLVAEKEVKVCAAHQDLLGWIRDAFRHLKVIGHNESAGSVFKAAGIEADLCVIQLDNNAKVKEFTDRASEHRFWEREKNLVQ